MQDQLPNNKHRTQSDIDAAIMLASFTAHVDEAPLSTENGVQSPADEQVRKTAEKHIISRQLHPRRIEKFPTMVRTTQLTTHNMQNSFCELIAQFDHSHHSIAQFDHPSLHAAHDHSGQ